MSSFTDRKELFEQLTTHRKRKLVTLVTSTKKPEQLFAAQIAQDILPVFYDIFRDRTREDKLDLLLYSAGGQIDTPWPLVNLLREYYEELHVIVPWRAHSAATLITLGGNTIEMGPLGSLSPIDPQLQVKFGDKKEVITAGIEDIYGYYHLIKDTLNLDASGKADALKVLANRIGPEILGKASRTAKEIRVIAMNLLRLHLKDETKINSIVSSLVEDLPSHQYMINRNEAIAIGLSVRPLDKESEKLSFQILNSYISEARMDEPGMHVDFGAEETSKVIEISRAFIETMERSFVFKTSYTFHKDGKVETKINQWTEVTG